MGTPNLGSYLYFGKPTREALAAAQQQYNDAVKAIAERKARPARITTQADVLKYCGQTTDTWDEAAFRRTVLKDRWSSRRRLVSRYQAKYDGVWYDCEFQGNPFSGSSNYQIRFLEGPGTKLGEHAAEHSSIKSMAKYISGPKKGTWVRRDLPRPSPKLRTDLTDAQMEDLIRNSGPSLADITATARRHGKRMRDLEAKAGLRPYTIDASDWTL